MHQLIEAPSLLLLGRARCGREEYQEVFPATNHRPPLDKGGLQGGFGGSQTQCGDFVIEAQFPRGVQFSRQGHHLKRREAFFNHFDRIEVTHDPSTSQIHSLKSWAFPFRLLRTTALDCPSRHARKIPVAQTTARRCVGSGWRSCFEKQPAYRPVLWKATHLLRTQPRANRFTSLRGAAE